jgi:hypothetical protein
VVNLADKLIAIELMSTSQQLNSSTAYQLTSLSAAVIPKTLNP